jgi:hypothetical protein
MSMAQLPPDYYNCRDCGVNTSAVGEWYMVKPEVWAVGGLGPKAFDGLLCIGCLETRLKRRLDPSDFAAVSVNVGVAASPRDCFKDLGDGDLPSWSASDDHVRPRRGVRCRR